MNSASIQDQMLKSYIDQIFIKYDKDNSGNLDSKEMTYFFNDLFRSINMNVVVNEQQSMEAIRSIDQNFDGKCSREELFAAFKIILNNSNQPPQQQYYNQPQYNPQYNQPYGYQQYPYQQYQYPNPNIYGQHYQNQYQNQYMNNPYTQQPNPYINQTQNPYTNQTYNPYAAGNPTGNNIQNRGTR